MSIGTGRGFNIVLLVTLFTNVVAMILCSPGCLDQIIWLHISSGNGCV